MTSSIGMYGRCLLIGISLLGVAAPGLARAQGPADIARAADEPAVPEKEGKVLRAYRIVGMTPRIDGRLDDEAWRHADSLDGLVQWEPDNMQAESQRTVVRVAYDDGNIYVGARLYDSEPENISGGLARRDDMPPSDQIYIGFDARHDHLTGLVFTTNPSGVQADFEFLDDTRSSGDFNAVWEVETAADELGWTAEFRIPFSQLRFETTEGRAVWGFEIARAVHRRGEHDQWVGRPRGEQGQVSRWGHLVFEDGVPSPRRLEVLPFVAGRRASTGLAGEVGYGLDGGVDVRTGLGSSASLAATVNPDFAQVEADPAVLNLSVFETFFPEKRPFFLEDGRTFIPPYGLFQLFHSRRIGRRPGYYALGSTDVLVSRPDQTTILGAAKLTGKRDGWTYGVLSTLTAPEHAVVDSINPDLGAQPLPVRTQRLIEPTTSYNAVRVQRDVLGGTSNIGAIGTAVARAGAADAVTGGVDYRIRWDRNRFQWNGHWAATHAPRGDQMVSGWGGVSNLSRVGKYYGVFLHVDHFSPDFRINDLGFHSTRPDRTAGAATFSLVQPDPWRAFRRLESWVGGFQSWNGDRLVLDRDVTVGIAAQFLNFWSVSINGIHDFERFDDLDTRGGPPILVPAMSSGNVMLASDSRKTWNVSLDAGGGVGSAGGWRYQLNPSLRVRPAHWMELSVGGGYESGVDIAQWIANFDADGDGETDHVYGTLHRDIVNLRVRGSVAASPDLTLQLFLQPFIAVGDYENPRKLARPRSFEFEPVTPFEADFNRKSIRGTAVARWEYNRGSTLYFVWNIGGLDSSRPGVFEPLRDLGDAIGADGEHVFMIKANYWLGM